MRDRIIDLTDGNPGALTVLSKVANEPNSGTLIQILEHHDVRGPEVWKLYKDECDEDIDAFVEHIRDSVPEAI